MLRALAVREFALLAAVDVEFGPGLNVLSGETGAGKSLVIDALQLVLGGRASADSIRNGERRARVEAVFERPEDGREVLLVREWTADGHGVCRIDGALATAALLRQAGEELIDIHGQDENASLLRPAAQVALLDSYAGPAAIELRARRSALLSEVAALEARRADPGGDVRRREFVAFQLRELDAAAAQRGEVAELAARREILRHGARLHEGAAAAYAALRDRPDVAQRLEPLAAIDERLRPALDLAREAEVAASEAAALLRRYRDSLAFEPGELDRVEARLAELERLRRKYGDDLLAAREALAAEQAGFEALELEREGIDRRLAAARAELEDVCGRLVDLRSAAAARLATALASELEPLAMGGARLSVRLAPDGSGGEFLLAANAGEAPLPLHRAASGGERARCFLALRVVLAAAERRIDRVDRLDSGGAEPEAHLRTLVFDEVDAGVGGLAAEAVAERLWRLARGRQVICVTHQASIAAVADVHLLIAKAVMADRTATVVRRVEGADRREELARMLSGHAGSAALVHADELLARVGRLSAQAD